MIKIKRSISILTVIIITALTLSGCSKLSEEEKNNNLLSDNVLLTETGEVLEKEPQPTEQPAEEPSPAPEVVTIEGQLTEPKQEQVETEEDQTEPAGNELQIVFLGDSIFDNSRDGTGIPYLTSEQCGADVYNLAIGGTSATVERGEEQGSSDWTSRSLVGVVKAILGEIPTDIFAGTKTKKILDNPDIDMSATDYFVIEYGMNDFFRAVSHSNPERFYDLTTYAGALRFAVSNLRSVAPDAAIIICSPNYAQFYSGNTFIGDGNTLNTGNGTLFDYKGTCEYVAKEQETYFLDAYLDLGIDGYTAEQYLEDGVHLTKEGRQLYADALAKIILDIEEDKNKPNEEENES